MKAASMAAFTLMPEVFSMCQIIRILVFFCACALTFDAHAGEPEPVRIGLVRAASAGPLLVTVAAGHFKAEGLEPQLSFLESDAAVSAAVAAGKLDVGLTSVSPAFYGF